jgi:deoxyribose-phosphate aldolase
MSTEQGPASTTGRIEHTVLGPETTPDDVIEVLDAAIEFGMRACVPPCYLDLADGYAPTVPLTTVVGFPHGQHATEVKCEEASAAWEAGADELDVVINVGRLRAGEDEVVTDDIAEVVAAVPIPVKVIVEAPLLSDAELRRAAEAAVAADADYLKTATGFSEGGATVADVEVLSEYLPVKASGGIGSWADAQAMFDAGAERIGASSGDRIAQEFLDQREGGTTGGAGDADGAGDTSGADDGLE